MEHKTDKYYKNSVLYDNFLLKYNNFKYTFAENEN